MSEWIAEFIYVDSDSSLIGLGLGLVFVCLCTCVHVFVFRVQLFTAGSPLVDISAFMEFVQQQCAFVSH
jgi:hypothetical protein